MSVRNSWKRFALALVGSAGLAGCADYSIAVDDGSGNSKGTHLSYTVQQDANAAECNEDHIGLNYADCTSFLSATVDFSDPDDARNPCADCQAARQAVVDAAKEARRRWNAAKETCPARSADARKPAARECAAARREFLSRGEGLRQARKALNDCRTAHSCRQLGVNGREFRREEIGLA